MLFQPFQIAEDLKRNGGYIPGVRPGKPTADFLDYTMTRLTFAGAIFLTIIFILPVFVGKIVGLPPGSLVPTSSAAPRCSSWSASCSMSCRRLVLSSRHGHHHYHSRRSRPHPGDRATGARATRLRNHRLELYREGQITLRTMGKLAGLGDDYWAADAFRARHGLPVVDHPIHLSNELVA